jgi:hypothetical protein
MIEGLFMLCMVGPIVLIIFAAVGFVSYKMKEYP